MASSASGAPFLNLIDLTARCGDDSTLADELLSLYQQASPLAIQRIRHGLDVGDLEDAAIASHSLAGTLANIGAPQPAADARALRVALGAGLVTVARARLDAVAADLARLDLEVHDARLLLARGPESTA